MKVHRKRGDEASRATRATKPLFGNGLPDSLILGIASLVLIMGAALVSSLCADPAPRSAPYRASDGSVSQSNRLVPEKSEATFRTPLGEDHPLGGPLKTETTGNH